MAANAFAFWDDATSLRIFRALQVCTVGGAVVYGLTVALRLDGIARWWRLLAVGSVACLLVGQMTWWLADGIAPAIGVISYWLFPMLALASVVLVVISGRGVSVPAGGTVRHTAIITMLDGGVAASSFAILVVIGGYGAQSSASMPHSGLPGLETAYAVLELVVVVIAAVVGMMYAADRPYRSNYLQLACGVVLIVASDRIIAYLESVQVAGGRVWGGIGLVLGPLIIALSIRERSDAKAAATGFHFMDWAQLILPYTGFIGITVLLSFDVLTGHQLTPEVVGTTMVMVVLVSMRQVAAMGAQRQLTRRLYEAQRGLAHQVHHDSLTGLPNRLLFAKRLDEAVQRGGFVLIFVDLDDFKEVNDRFGHAAGDELLCAVGERLMRVVDEGDTLARIGGDEFAILLNGSDEVPEVLADRLRMALRDPFPVHGSSVSVRASMGLVRSDVDGPSQTPDDLLRQADISMYAGKRFGKDTAVVYQPATGVQAGFPAVLREAAGEVPDGFSLAYQPVVRLSDQALVAVEALARWTAPNGMLVPPETFVAVAEAAGLGATLDALVLDLACSQVMASGLEVNVHVNVGAARLGNPAFEEQVRRTCQRYGIEPGRLVLEITETVPIVDLDDAAAQIDRFNDIGVRFALDDFGAGYNSLTYLHALPVHFVKLDRSLAVGSDPDRTLALYRSVIGLCTDLGLDVVAEGIESQVQADTLRAAGCQFVQGHLFGKPALLDELAQTWGQTHAGAASEHRSQSVSGRVPD